MLQFMIHGVAFAVLAWSAPAPQGAVERQLLAAALGEMVADDLVFIEASGKRSGKPAFIAGWTAAGDRFDPVTLVDRRLVPLGREAFLVTAETMLTGVSDGKRFASAFRFTDIFRWIDGRWQAVHIQVTRLPAGK